jgi:hypothetical protein
VLFVNLRQCKIQTPGNFIGSGRIKTLMQLQSVSSLGGKIPTPYSIKRKGEAAEVAELIAWLLSDSTKYISGTVELIDGF